VKRKIWGLSRSIFSARFTQLMGGATDDIPYPLACSRATRLPEREGPVWKLLLNDSAMGHKPPFINFQARIGIPQLIENIKVEQNDLAPVSTGSIKSFDFVWRT